MSLESFFEDLNFWVRGGEDAFIEALTKMSVELDEIRMHDVRAVRRVLMLVSQLGSKIFKKFTWRSPFVYIGSYGATYGGENTYELNQSYKHYLMSAGIVERVCVKRENGRKSCEEYMFMFLQYHACEALESVEYLERAELFMKEKLLEWNKKSKDVIYGIIFIGGKMAMYLLDKETHTFSRLLSGGTLVLAVSPVEPGVWQPIADKSGLKYLLQIFMREWCRTDEKKFREEIALRPIIEAGLKQGRTLSDIIVVEEGKRRLEGTTVRKEELTNEEESGSSLENCREIRTVLENLSTNVID